MQKTNEAKELNAENLIKRKEDELYIKWKGYDNSTDSWTDKKDIVNEMKCLPEPYTCSKSKVKVELDSSNHVTKSDFKNAAVIDT